MIFNCQFTAKLSLLAISFVVGSHTLNAQSGSVDTDGDGVINSIDLDDDNDGILDEFEYAPAYCNASPSCATNASLSASAQATGTAVSGWSNYGNGGTPDISQGNWHLFSSQVSSASALFPYAPAGTYFIYGMSKNGSGTAGGWAPYGEAFSQTLTCLIPGNMYTISFKGALTRLSSWTSPWTAPTKGNFVLVRDGATVATSQDIFLEAASQTITLSFMAVSTSHTITIAHTNPAANDLSLMVIQAGSGFFCTGAFNNTVDIDTDGDGISNRFDLDSDGDGCSDAFEGGATKVKSDSLMSAPFGANGFANNKETSAENGVLNYTNIYSSYAKTASSVACLDTDNDGIEDVYDLDDDNDGIPDDKECVISYAKNKSISTFTINSYFTQRTGCAGNGDQLWYYNNPYYRIGAPNDLCIAVNGNNITDYATGSLSNGTILAVNGGGNTNGFKEVFSFSEPVASNRNYTIKMPYFNWGCGGQIIVKINGNVVYLSSSQTSPNFGEWAVENISWYSGSATTMNVSVEVYDNGSSCNDYLFDDFSILSESQSCDADGDGVPNRLDLDSDGDGCYDAFEAGATSVVSDSTIAGPYGTNGLANSKETSTDNGILNYVSNYNTYAISSNIATCRDLDGDGILDLNDIDDDNDGTIDAVESPSCFYSVANWFSGERSQIVSSTGLSMHATYNRLVQLADGVNGTAVANYAVNFLATTAAAKTVYAFDMSVPVEIAKLYIGYVNTNTHFNAGTFLKLQGSNDNTTWLNLSDSIAYNTSVSTNGVTSIFGLTGTINANVFPVTKNSGKYRYYRIYWTNGGGINANGFSNEIYIENPTNYIASLNPSTSCTNDIDSDGKFNHLDVDSDGDGCSDAKESGATTVATANFAFSGSMGSNGLDNSLETTADNGNINYTSYYINAVDTSKNGCIDTDTDGIGDLIDIDDDNDGVLDTVENVCINAQSTIPKTSGSTIGSSKVPTGWIMTGGSTDVSDVNRWQGTYYHYVNGSIKDPVATPPLGDNTTTFLTAWEGGESAEASFTFPEGGEIVVFLGGFSTSGQNGLAPASFTVDKNDVRILLSNGTIIYGTGTVLQNGGWNPITFTVPALSGTHKFQLMPSAGLTTSDNMVNLHIPGSVVSTCKDKDTDNDGIPNIRDLDSDGDGCSDAFEAGATTNKTDSIIAGPYGTNGFANSKETGVDNGQPNYNSTYNSYALSNSIPLCKDTDNDGITDINDIDDDNDGTLDAVESPNCFFSVSEWFSGNRSHISVSSSLAMNTTYNLLGKLTDGDNGTNAASYGVVFNATTTAPASVYAIDMSIPVEITKLYVGYASTNTHFNASTFLKLQGSNDNAIWINLNDSVAYNTTVSTNGVTSIFGLAGTINANVFPVTKNSGKYRYYRVYWTNGGGINANGYSNEIYFETPTNYQASLNPKSKCIDDKDKDGIKNHLDLDSDNDGCSDAKEAGATTTSTANFKFSGTVGSNGLDNSLETSVDNGNINYIPYYSNAIDSTSNGCIDTDNDGIGNLIDIDDDNDGVLDIEESNCYLLNETFGSATTESFSIPNSNVLYTTSQGNIANILPSAPWFTGALDHTPNDLNGNMLFVYNIDVPMTIYTKTINNLQVGKNYDFSAFIANPLLAGYTSPNLTLRVKNNSNVIIKTINTGDIPSGAVNWVQYLATFTAPTSSVVLEIVSNGNGTNNTGNDFIIDDITFALSNCDTDNDGIPNSLDLDSDNDGCSDAFESNATTVKTDSIIAGPYGANGLANSKETSVDNGSINYSSTYSPFALSPTIGVCKDNDGDGIIDITDIDDDNDGVLDATESPTCFYNASEWLSGNRTQIVVTTGLAMNTTYNKISKLEDGDNGTAASSYAVQFNATTSAPATVYSFDMSLPVEISKLYLGYVNTNTHFNANTFLKLQGSNDNSIWTNLNDSIAYNTTVSTNGVTSIFGLTGTINANVFPVTKNSNKYRYYRIYWTNGGGINVNGYSNEIYIETPTNYQASLNPKLTCIEDKDLDGKLNHLDLDSDGDGCSDAKEAGATSSSSANFKFTGTMGTNGLDNSLETTADNGSINYVSFYQNAIDNTKDGCLDSDNDNIGDLIDIDDDNDGVLDIDEIKCVEAQSCSYFDSKFTGNNLVVNGGFDNGNVGFTTSYAHTPGGSQGCSDYYLATSGWVNATGSCTGNKAMQINADCSGGQVPFWCQEIDVKSFTNYKFGFSMSHNSVSYIAYSVDNGPLSTSVPTTANWSSKEYIINSGAKTRIKICLFETSKVSGGADFGIDDIYLISEDDASCSKDTDTDNDGIPNRLDTDSDGDGCSDALEAGATTSSTSNFTFSGPFGANGLDNSKETVTDNGSINYASNYSSYALTPNIALCLDTDNDGILDINDIDDDNDGVLDATESPSCFYNASEWFSGNRPQIITTSSLSLNATYNKLNLLVDGDNGTATTSYAANFIANTTAPATVYNFDMTTPVEISKLYLGYINTNTHFNANTFLKLQGSKDNLTWTNLSDSVAYNTTVSTNGVTSIFGLSGTINANVFPVTKNIGKYRYYRIYWTNGGGINANGTSNEIYIELPTNYNQSLNPKIACNQDADNDGKYNHLDLDSDGDGCGDAKEAGSTTSTTANFKFTGNVGANGLDNTLETSVDNGTINYTIYYNNAINTKLNGCTDTDGDGISDLIDIDDDNDGVLDEMEIGTCALDPVCTTFPGNNSFAITSSGCLGWTTTNGNFDFIQPYNGKPLFDLQGSAIPLYGLMKKTYKTLANVGYSFTVGLHTGQFVVKEGITPVLRAINPFSGATIATLNLNQNSNTTINFTAASDSTRIEVGYPTASNTNSGNIFWYPLDLILTSNCADIDTDGDSIPNRLDTDSDNDGCSDALEAGATTSTTANFTFSGPFGTNGLADNKETLVDNGIINYGTNYAPYALSANIAACRDFDNDGIMDFVDVDDDNDGVLDAVESPSCFYNASEWLSGNRPQIIATSGVAMNATYNRLNLLDDGNNATAVSNYAVQFNATTSAPAVVYSFDMNVPVEINKLYLGYINTNTHFNANTFIRLQGSNDNLAWINLNDSFAYNTTTATNGTSSVPGVPGTNNANIFPVTKNSGKYRYYRIYWSSGGGINANGVSNEVYFETANTYNSNQNPKATCAEDGDNDKKFNHLDTDSDNDGCSDALEAGATTSTTANFTFAAPFGTNGLADSKETATDNGIVNYVVSYEPYATSSNLAICRDFDNDGITDLIDIDDDNDGIIDAVESPSCFYSSAEWLSGDRNVASVSSSLNMNATYNSPSELVDGDNGTTAANYAVNFTATTAAPAVVYTFTMPVPVELGRIYLGYVNSNTHFNANTFLKLQGSNNNITWSDLSDSIAYNTTVSIMGVTNIPGVTGTNNANIFPINKNQGSYKYYRIYWTNGGGINVNGVSNEVYFETPITYNQSLNPKPKCGEDIDNDGVYNHFDLDSDSDGCSDAFEGNATTSKTANFTFPAPYGTNGLANALETQPDNGTVNYTNTYSSFAKNKKINTCLDSDNDGIADYIDIDDDNDGVLDVTEENKCQNNDYSIDVAVDNGTSVYTNCAGSIDGPGVNFYGFTLAPYTGTKYMGFHHTESMSVKIPTTSPIRSGVPYRLSVATANASINSWNSNFPARMDVYAGTASCGTSQLIGSTTLLPAPGNVGSVTAWVLDDIVFTPNADHTHITFVAREAVTGSGNKGYILVDGLNLGENISSENCTALNDIDKDGIPNSLDTDSDGDGCSDAYEAGATTSTATNYTFTGPYGTNGLANSKETVTDNGILNYSSTYNYFGQNKLINACKDSDGDGIKDLVDIDDDNDGILDEEEGSLCSKESYNILPLNGSFEDLPGGTDAYNSNVSAGGWLSGTGTADSWISPTPTTNSGQWGGLGDGTPPSPDGGVYVAALSHNNTQVQPEGESFYTTINGLIPGQKYTISFYHAEAGVDGITSIGDKGRFRVAFGSESQFSSELPYLGEGNQVWAEDYLVFTPTATSQRLEFFANCGTDGYIGTTTYNYHAIDGLRVLKGEFKNSYDLCTDIDTDGDSIPNRLDLDSDNDGCSDAYEGGSTTSTTANYKFNGTMGANGLDNSKETAVDNGVLNYTPTYKQYAKEAKIKSCLDTDGDGIKDIDDIDDDNDGVLDTTECPINNVQLCFDGSFGSTLQVGFTSFGCLTPSIGTPDIFTPTNSYTNVNPSPNGGAYYTANMWPAGGHNESSVFPIKKLIVGATYKIKFYQSSVGQGIDWNQGGQWLFKNGNTVLASSSYMPPANGVGGKTWTYQELPFVATADSMILTLSAFTTSSAGCRLGLDGLSIDIVTLIECDSDNDGIVNRLDLDTDNDGCSDAFEANATKITTSNYVIPGPYGANGLADSKETAPENGIPNYIHTYSKARDSLSKTCFTPDFSDNNGLEGNVLNLCQKNGGTYQLVAKPTPANSGAVIKWYTVATGGTASTSAPTVSLSNTGTVSYWASQTLNGSEGPRAEIIVRVNAFPAAPTSILGLTSMDSNSINIHSVTAVANASGYIWTLPSGWKGTSTTNYITDTAGSNGGIIYVKATNNGCLSDSVALNVNVKSAKPNISNNKTIYCQNDSAVQLTATGSNLKWYTSPTISTFTTTAPTPPTAAPGTYSYYVSQTVNGNISDRAEIIIVVNPIPAQPGVIVGPTAVNSGDTVTYFVSGSSIDTGYIWSKPATWTYLSTNINKDTIKLLVGNQNAGIVSVVKKDTNSCSSEPQKITIKPAKPNTNGNIGILNDTIKYCQGTIIPQLTASLNPVNNGGKLYWYNSQTGGIGDTIAPTPSSLSPSTTTYWVGQTVSGIESDRSKIVIVINPSPNQPNPIVGATSVVSNTSYTYSVTAVVGATSYTWTKPNGWVGSSTSNSITLTTDTSSIDTITVTANIGLCSSTPQKLIISLIPQNPTAVDSVVYCQNTVSSQLTASLNPANNGGKLKWYTAISGGVGDTMSPTPSTLNPGTTFYYVSQTVNGAESGRTPVKVIVNPSLNQPNSIVGPNTVLANTAYTYNVGAVSGALSYTWTKPNGWTGTSTTNTLNVTTDTTTTGTISVVANGSSCSSLPQTLTVIKMPNSPLSNVTGDSIVYCQGATATQITASLNPANNGGKLKWYTSSTGGVGDTIAPTPSTAVAATINYYVSQTVNGVESGRTAIKVVVKAAPNQPNSIVGTSAVSANTAYTYSVTAVTGATSYTWTKPNGWTGTSTTNILNITTDTTTTGTVSVVANIGSCSSLPQTMTISALPSSPISGVAGDSIVYCLNTAATQLTASLNPTNNGGKLKWYTSATGGVGDTIAPTPSTATAGTTYYYVSQTVNGIESSRTPIKVIVRTAPNQPNTIQGPSSVSPNSTVVYSVGAVSGATSYTWTTPSGWVGTSTTNVLTVTTDTVTTFTIRVTANFGACKSAPQSLKIGTIPNNPFSGLAGDSIVYCQNATATQFNASLNPANNGGQLKWYTAATGGIGDTIAPTPSTSTVGTTNYYVGQTVNGIESGRTVVKVIIKSTPSQPNSIQGTSAVSSNTSYTYSVSAVPGATSYTWTKPNGWTGTSTTNSITLMSDTSSGVITVTANLNNCSSVAQSLTVTQIPNNPSSGVIGDSVVYCQGATATQLTATLNPLNNGGKLKWYTSPTGGVADTIAPTPSTIFASTTYYYVSQTVNGVESGRTAIKVIVKPVPNQPNTISGPTAVNASTSYTYSIGSVLGATSYTWTLPNGWTGSSTTNSIGINTSSTTSGIITVKANLGGCSSAAQTLNVGGVPSDPDLSGNTNLVGDSIVYCQNTTATQLTASLNPSNNGGTLNWYTVPTGGSASATAPTPSTNASGTTFYYVSQTVSGVESARKAIKVVVKPAPNQPNTITGPSSVSANTSYVYSISSVSGATSYTWTLPNGWTGTSNTTSINVTTNTITSGLVYVTANLGSCSSIAQSITIGTLPNNPTTNLNGDSIVYCQGASAAQLVASLSPTNNGGTLKWYTVASGGTASTTAPTPSTLTAGTTLYYVSQTVGGVESNRTIVKVIVKPVPAQASLTTTQPTCAVTTATITVTAPINGAYKYSVDSINYSLNATFNGVASGSRKVYVKDTTSGCTSSIATTINAAPAAPANPTVQLTQPSCQSATGSIVISAPTGSNFIYSIDSINYQSNVTFSGVSAGTYRVRVKNIQANCATDTGTKVVINSFSGTPNQPGPISGPVNPTIGSTVTYSIDTVAGATSYTWTVPTGWSISSGQNTKSISVVVGSTGGTISVKANNNSGCSSAAQTLDVNKLPAKPVIDPANSNIVGNTITYCQGTVASALRADSTVSGAMIKWYTGTDSISASSAGAIDTGSTGPIPSTAVGNTQTMYWVSQTVNGEEGIKALIIVKINPTPSQPNTIVGNAVVLAGSAQIYSVNAVPGAASYTWTLPSGWSGTSTTNSISVTVGTLGGSIKVKANIGNCSSQDQTLAVNIKPSAPDNTSNTGISGNTITYCQGATANQLSATGISGSTLKWYDSDGTTVLSPAPTPSTEYVQLKTYYVSQIVNGVESDKATINIKVNSAPAQPNPIQGDTLVTKGSTKTYTVSAVPGATSYTWTLPNGWTGTSTTNSITVVADSIGGTITVKANATNCSSPIQTLTVKVKTSSNNDADGDGIPDDAEKGNGSTPKDTDGDGTPDYQDSDSDNDGIPDSDEDSGCTGTSPCTPTDTDGDGTPDYQDSDSDNDGIPDSGEKGNGSTPKDTDGDGIPDYRDPDSDGDGIPDSNEKGNGSTPKDTDGDGIPDYQDSDSDNDGIPDSDEDSGCTGTSPCTPTDTDGDGTPDYTDTDSDNDGISDNTEKGNGTTPKDTDGDGIPDFRDPDSDGDGIPDSTEKGNGSTQKDTDGDGIPDYLDPDSDGDGIPDALEDTGCNGTAPCTPTDTDGDGTPDYLDTDSDGDGIPDNTEDTGCNGTVPCTPSDKDGDGIPNYKDTDSDGDGIPDSVEKGSGTSPQDSDGDGIPNYLDLDSDNDGILDAYENQVCPTSVVLCDTDGDGIPNYIDLDSDGDGKSDVSEAKGTDANNDGKADGTPNADGIPSSAGGGLTPPDTNLDGKTDPYDIASAKDTDGDGISDDIEKGSGTTPKDSDGDGIPDFQDLDSDNDGILDAYENTRCSSTSSLCDTDGDGIPNYLDLDSDGDGIRDVTEANGTDANNDGKADGTVDSKGVPSSAGNGLTPPDTDADNKTNPYDTDSDGDGILDAAERGSGNKPVDTDNDGKPDYVDTDSDGDGIPDSLEKGSGSAPQDTDGDGIPNYLDLDSDNDGILDAFENNVCVPSVALCDIDGDGIPNYMDLDSDNDSIPDVLESNGKDDNKDGKADGASNSKGIPSSATNGNTPPNTDALGYTDPYDLDSDNDGIPDSIEKGSNGSTPRDTDGDGIPDFRDVDSDGDGNTDQGEGEISDCDSDGIPDYLDTDLCTNDEFPNYITPNGDNKNDYFVLPLNFTKKYPNAKIVIYNRWGNIVWRSVGAYNNDWNGIHYDNQVLPDGVYYYVLELDNEFAKIKTGFVQIMRD